MFTLCVRQGALEHFCREQRVNVAMEGGLRTILHVGRKPEGWCGRGPIRLGPGRQTPPRLYDQSDTVMRHTVSCVHYTNDGEDPIGRFIKRAVASRNQNEG
ncbi:hypothetical protein EVAR_8050_1 [Eumeta japonica]|uniref:Uncharacterized protein n=1 Tax=Eumeta variegata TaxID=151549 RepID=A0A4C1TH49_EUMVA|nr:hypothetical protein EVAR_8050_1 [Eumeta japonica]